MPKVSICIPTYNSARFLAETIESALAQDFGDFELVISDNASTDETPALCARYSDPRIRYNRFETLVGQGGNWNRCVSLAKGEFVALLHADDVYLPDFLTERVRQFAEASDTGIAFGAVELMDAAGQPIGGQSFSDHARVARAPEFYGDLLMGCVINPASLLVRRSLYSEVGPFNEQRLWGIDWDMWLRLAAISGVSYSPRASSRYRIHGASGSTTGLLGPRYLAEDFSVLKGALERLEKDPKLAGIRPRRWAALRAYSMRAMYAAEANCLAGRRLSTLSAVSEAVRNTPSLLAKPTTWALALGGVLGSWPYRTWKGLRSPSTSAQPASPPKAR